MLSGVCPLGDALVCSRVAPKRDSQLHTMFNVGTLKTLSYLTSFGLLGGIGYSLYDFYEHGQHENYFDRERAAKVLNGVEEPVAAVARGLHYQDDIKPAFVEANWTGAPPPPPPPAVPPLDASNDDLGPLTLKQQIELHAEQSACAACHAKIDPWGLPLESFDAIGAWREDALVVNPNTAVRSLLPVDSSTVLATGEEISGSEDLVEYLHTEREDEFAASLTWHMMTYALGRAPNLGDADDLASIHRHFRTSGYRLSELALAIVQSDAFLVMPDRPALPETESLQATADTDNPLH